MKEKFEDKFEFWIKLEFILEWTDNQDFHVDFWCIRYIFIVFQKKQSFV